MSKELKRQRDKLLKITEKIDGLIKETSEGRVNKYINIIYRIN
jgi:hypothetical protein